MGKRREHSPEFRVEIAKRMVAGENVTAMSARYQLPRSLMYRWRDAYRKYGPDGLSGKPGNRSAISAPGKLATASEEQKLRQRIAELERKVGRQAEEIDFFKGVFKRLEELPKAKRSGGEASTRRSEA